MYCDPEKKKLDRDRLPYKINTVKVVPRVLSFNFLFSLFFEKKKKLDRDRLPYKINTVKVVPQVLSFNFLFFFFLFFFFILFFLLPLADF